MGEGKCVKWNQLCTNDSVLRLQIREILEADTRSRSGSGTRAQQSKNGSLDNGSLDSSTIDVTGLSDRADGAGVASQSDRTEDTAQSSARPPSQGIFPFTTVTLLDHSFVSSLWTNCLGLRSYLK